MNGEGATAVVIVISSNEEEWCYILV
jgi:hypothetical protein